MRVAHSPAGWEAQEHGGIWLASSCYAVLWQRQEQEGAGLASVTHSCSDTGSACQAEPSGQAPPPRAAAVGTEVPARELCRTRSSRSGVFTLGNKTKHKTYI